MRKRLFAFSAGVLAASLGGCSGQDQGDQPLDTSAATTSYSARLWVLDETGNCTSALKTFLPYVVGNTNFNAMTAKFPGGVQLSWGGIKTGNAGCAAALSATCSGFSHSLVKQQLQ